jgi:hypothetical protein
MTHEDKSVSADTVQFWVLEEDGNGAGFAGSVAGMRVAMGVWEN